MSLGGVVVIIPAYEPSSRLVSLVAELSAAGVDRLLVVDDGSGPAYRQTFDAVCQVSGVELLRHEVNRGKGAAMRTAIAHVMRQGALTGVVTADADGQHTVADIRRVADMLTERAPGTQRLCVLGERDFDLPQIPLRSRLGNKVTTALISALFGRRLPDTQTGLRGMTADLLPELLDVPGERFDHEMRAIMHLLTTGAHIVPVAIETVYEGGQNSTSHFRPVRDSAVIYAAILRQLGTFGLTSGLGFLIDILTFVAVMDGVFDGHPTLRAVGIATLTARVVSALANYAVNHLLVFRTGTKVPRSLGRYVVLAGVLLTASWLLTTGAANLLGHHVVWAKVLVDTLLFFASYLVQRRWVFAPPRGDANPSIDGSAVDQDDGAPGLGRQDELPVADADDRARAVLRHDGHDDTPADPGGVEPRKQL